MPPEETKYVYDEALCSCPFSLRVSKLSIGLPAKESSRIFCRENVFGIQQVALVSRQLHRNTVTRQEHACLTVKLLVPKR